MSGRPKDQAISEDEYRRKEADAMQRTADQNRALRSMVGRLRALASDWEANSGSRGLGERSEATAWSKAASQLREAISPSEPQAEPSSEVPEPSADSRSWIPHARRALQIHDTWGTPDDPDGKVRPMSDYTELSARMALSPDCRDGNKHRACLGDAWNDTTDQPCACECA